MQKRNLTLFALFLSMTMFGCQPKPVLIDLSGIEKINSVELSSDGAISNSPIKLTNEFIVNKWKNYLIKINHGWERPWDTFPTPKYTVSLNENGSYKFAVYSGLDYVWVGVRKGDQSSAMHRLSAEESNELKDLVKESKTGH